MMPKLPPTPIDVASILQKIAGYKGLPFPGAYVPWLAGPGAGVDNGGDYQSPKRNKERNIYSIKGTNIGKEDEARQKLSSKGTAIYKIGEKGTYYFMPVTFLVNEKEYDIDCAMVSIVSKKTLITTSLVGRKGSVKELINIDDYQISIVGAVIGYDNIWPEGKLDDINELYNLNQAVELRCALTDVFLSAGDKVVITDLNIPQMPQTEHVQVIELKCITDRPQELIIE